MGCIWCPTHRASHVHTDWRPLRSIHWSRPTHHLVGAARIWAGSCGHGATSHIGSRTSHRVHITGHSWHHAAWARSSHHGTPTSGAHHLACWTHCCTTHHPWSHTHRSIGSHHRSTRAPHGTIRAHHGSTVSTHSTRSSHMAPHGTIRTHTHGTIGTSHGSTWTRHWEGTIGSTHTIHIIAHINHGSIGSSHGTHWAPWSSHGSSRATHWTTWSIHRPRHMRAHGATGTRHGHSRHGGHGDGGATHGAWSAAVGENGAWRHLPIHTGAVEAGQEVQTGRTPGPWSWAGVLRPCWQVLDGVGGTSLYLNIGPRVWPRPRPRPRTIRGWGPHHIVGTCHS